MIFNGVKSLINKIPVAEIALGAVAGIVESTTAFNGNCTFQAILEGTGAISGTVGIQASNNGLNWITLGTISLSGTTSATDGFASTGAWAFHRAYVAQNGITGTNATITVLMGS